jgi:hypothetical protein
VPREQLDAEVDALTELVLAKSRFAIRRSKYVLRNAAEVPMAQAAAFELGVDPGAGPRDVDGFDSFTNKTSALMTLRERSASMWADQRV